MNHAGEHGAIAIYRAQIAAVEGRRPDLSAWLRETLAHEVRHRALFRDAMTTRDAKPCRALCVWSVGGGLLGRVTSWFGQPGVMICTAAVERTVHKHLEHQIAYLSARDPELAEVVRSVQADEIEHLTFAERHHDARSAPARALAALVSAATEVLIWISTRGDSTRLHAALGASRARA